MRRHEGDAKVVLVRGEVELAIWPLPAAGQPTLEVVDELARLQLAARRRGCSIRLHDAPAALIDLLYLVGLGEVVPHAKDLRLESCGEAEDREQVSVEEVVVPDDPAG